MTTPKLWLTRPDLSERWQIPPHTLANWASAGKGPRFTHFGKHVRYHLDDVIAYENEKRGESA